MDQTRIATAGGSPLLTVDGEPAAWFENWILNDPRHLMVVAPKQGGKTTLQRRWQEAQRERA